MTMNAIFPSINDCYNYLCTTWYYTFGKDNLFGPYRIINFAYISSMLFFFYQTYVFCVSWKLHHGHVQFKFKQPISYIIYPYKFVSRGFIFVIYCICLKIILVLDTRSHHRIKLKCKMQIICSELTAKNCNNCKVDAKKYYSTLPRCKPTLRFSLFFKISQWKRLLF